MRKIPSFIALICVATFALSACDQGDKAKQEVVEQAPVVLPMPTNATDKNAWKAYLVSVVTANMQGVKSNHPYMYFVPGGDDDVSKADRNNQLENVRGIVGRGVLPGNMLAFGGPNSSITSQLVVDAFKDVQPGSFKDVVVLFIGTRADSEAIKQQLASSQAIIRIVEAK